MMTLRTVRTFISKILSLGLAWGLLQPGPSLADAGLRAQALLPGVIPQGHVFATAPSQDGKEIYFCAEFPERATMEIHVTRLVDGTWTQPKAVSFTGGNWRDIDPFLTPDGKRMIFNSNRPFPDGTPRKDFDLYVVERVGDGWGEPERMPDHLQSDKNDYFAVTSDAGDLYFASDRLGGKGLSDIWMAKKAVRDGLQNPRATLRPGLLRSGDDASDEAS
jgi:hypothetical protein